MSRAGKYATQDLIVLTLREEGPMCTRDIALAAGKSYSAISAAIVAMRKRGGLLRISGWKRSTGTRGREGAIWALGTKPDVPRPTFDPLERKRTYAKRHRAVIRLRDQVRRGTLNPYRALMLG